MRLLIHSNAPWVNTGYGVQTRLFAPRIRDLGHEVGISALYGSEGHVQEWNGIPVFPKLFAQYGVDAIPRWAEGFNADAVISLIDAWVLDGEAYARQGVRWCPWFPVDADPLPAAVARQVRHAHVPLVFSRHAERLCRDAGIEPSYVPHGLDASIYCPGDREAARTAVGVPQDAFVVAMVMANKGTPPRKCWPQQLEALSRVMARHTDVVLYLHTHVGTEIQGVNVLELMEALAIPPDRVVICDQLKNAGGGYSCEDMAQVYRAADVLANVTMGEGFGVPVIEAAACGTPALVGAWTAMDEVLVSGWKVPVERAERYWIPVGAWQYIPHTAAIEQVMEAAYLDTHEDREKVAARAAELYDADRVTETYWRPALERIERSIAEPEPREFPEPELVAA